uniref:RNA polymerase II subunit A C-terminal domain phosphatase SSU72 n=1 Tax=Rousettus aegyptiacus TaxID=9407 RepID=A0A7J8EM60_ROUAE|nr:hypothetical protein HJG63_018529 [Rousettus aegyptiacus]
MPPSLRVAVVCWSNQNRSMEAHNILGKRGFSVRSFGTGAHVKLPGPSPDRPNVYDYHTTYEQMYNDLVSKDKDFYTRKGILHMLARKQANQASARKVPGLQRRLRPDPHLRRESVRLRGGRSERQRAGDLPAGARDQRGHPGQRGRGHAGGVRHL